MVDIVEPVSVILLPSPVSRGFTVESSLLFDVLLAVLTESFLDPSLDNALVVVSSQTPLATISIVEAALSTMLELLLLIVVDAIGCVEVDSSSEHSSSTVFITESILISFADQQSLSSFESVSCSSTLTATANDRCCFESSNVGVPLMLFSSFEASDLATVMSMVGAGAVFAGLSETNNDFETKSDAFGMGAAIG